MLENMMHLHFNTLVVLNLGDNFDVCALFSKEFTNFLNTLFASNEGGKDDIKLEK